MLFNSLVISAVNCGPLSNTILSGNLYNFHILSLNNLANSFAEVSSVVATKCVILNNLLQTTRIAFFLATNSSFVIKSTIKYIYSFSRTSLSFNFPCRYLCMILYSLVHIPFFSSILYLFLSATPLLSTLLYLPSSSPLLVKIAKSKLCFFLFSFSFLFYFLFSFHLFYF